MEKQCGQSDTLACECVRIVPLVIQGEVGQRGSHQALFIGAVTLIDGQKEREERERGKGKEKSTRYQ